MAARTILRHPGAVLRKLAQFEITQKATVLIRQAFEPLEKGHWPVTEDLIRERAYFISLQSGGANPRADWCRAEAEFQAEAGGVLPHEPHGTPRGH
jgi:hypothetical protein